MNSKKQELSDRLCKYYYDNLYSKYRPVCYKTTKKTKDGIKRRDFYDNNIKYFNKLIEQYDGNPKFDPDLFIRAIICECSPDDIRVGEKPEIFFFPQQLTTKGAWEAYERNIELAKGNVITLSKISTEIENDYELQIKKVKAFFDFMGGKTMDEVLVNPEKYNKILNNLNGNKPNASVICFSKRFELSTMSGAIDFPKERAKIKIYPKLLAKIKEKLGDDFLEKEKEEWYY